MKQADRGGGTIAAAATAPGRSAVAIVRVSGPAAGAVLGAVAPGGPPAPRTLRLAALVHPITRAVLDRALVAWFPGPGRATGEDVAEFHVHGGRAVVAAVLAAVLTVPDVRLAEPGEFTRRAFEAGKLDLSAVEGLADLIDSETEHQRRQALMLLEGRLAAALADWRNDIVDAMARVEASLDFADEGDVPADVAGGALPLIESVAARVRAALAGA